MSTIQIKTTGPEVPVLVEQTPDGPVLVIDTGTVAREAVRKASQEMSLTERTLQKFMDLRASRNHWRHRAHKAERALNTAENPAEMGRMTNELHQARLLVSQCAEERDRWAQKYQDLEWKMTKKGGGA